jgi:hypothetical protein
MYVTKWNVDDGDQKVVMKFLWLPKKLLGKFKWFQFVNIRQICFHNILCPGEYFWKDFEFISETPMIIEKKIGFLMGWLYGGFGVALIGATAYGAIRFHAYDANACMYWINGLLITGTLNAVIAIVSIIFKSTIKKFLKKSC